MSFEISLNGVWDGEYQTVLKNNKCKMALNISPYSFEKYLKDLFREVPNDFRDVVYAYLVDCATKYFEAHPNAKGYVGFFELLGEIAEEDYEGDENDQSEC